VTSTHTRYRWLADNGVSTRSVALVVGVLLLQLAFIASYLGAFHRPTPHDIDIAVTSETAARQLNALPGSPLRAKVVADRAAVVQAIDNRNAYGGLVSTPASDELLVASADGGTLSIALQEIFRQLSAKTGRPLTIVDVKPLPPGDPRGLAGFYLVVGWTVGGYLVASALSVSHGARPANRRRAGIRLTALAAYAIVSGIAGTAISYSIVTGMPHHFWALAAVGALLVFGVGATTMVFQVVSGILGIAIAVLLFVVLGNPSSGGSYPVPLLPPFWAAIGKWLPPGAGVDAFRSIVYFDATRLGLPLLVLTAYAVLGAAGTLILSAGRHPLAADVDAFGTERSET
jgi:hypothetical protein